MNKRWIGLIVVLMIISIVGAAQPVSGSAQTPELVMWLRDDYDWSLVEPIRGAFERDYGVALRTEIMPLDDIRQRFPEEAAGENAPDIITDSDELVRGYLDQNLLQPVDLGGKTTEYVPFAVQAFTHEGRLYALPYVLENLGFVRNTDLVPDMPGTWDEVYEMARMVRENGAADFGFVVPMDSLFYHFSPVIDAFGGYMFGTTPEGIFDRHDTGLDNDGAIAAVSWLQRMVQDGLTPGDMNWEDAHVAFEQGRVAMMITGPWGVWRFADAGVPFAVSAFPAAVHPGGPYVHVQGFLINARSDKKPLAQEFLTRYIATEDMMRGIAEGTGRVSANMVVFESMDNPVLRGFEDALQYARRYPDLPQMGMIQEVMSEALRQVIMNNQPPEAVLPDAVANIRRDIGGGQ
jgi:arabinogalactan oligomer/maltooligosaccharide transport system substrate-binding protein